MKHTNLGFLAHNNGDTVAVAVQDIEPGEAKVGFLDGSTQQTVTVNTSIPLGHKVALHDLSNGEKVMEYSLPIGLATSDIAEGDYVHTHNIRSARWQNSVA
jgi:(2R)-sulfolactate sulfo-lyase subunit alpha